jgi:glycosyltransferase involved in cell wall biosynthesis
MISIIIPAYQSVHTVRTTLESVQNQTFHDYEILITDDGSSDDTLQICCQYARERPEMRISISSIPHAGVAAARNNAIARASGEFVAFLDADDRWTPEKLERVAALISSDPQADLIYHDAMVITPSGRSWKEVSGPPPADPYRHLLLENNFLATTSVTVRRSCLKTGGFDCNPNFEICEDYELWVRLARSGAKFAYLPEVLAEIVRAEGSLSSNIVRHMTNRLNVRRFCLQRAFDDGVLSATELKRHRYRIAARCQAKIAIAEGKQRHLMPTLQSIAATAGALFQVVIRGDWEMVRQSARQVLRRLRRRSTTVPSR